MSGLVATQRVNRFVTGQYANDRHWGTMLGCALKLPPAAFIAGIDSRIRATDKEGAKLDGSTFTSMHWALGPGSQGHIIRLTHMFVDMTPAAAISAAKKNAYSRVARVVTTCRDGIRVGNDG